MGLLMVWLWEFFCYRLARGDKSDVAQSGLVRMDLSPLFLFYSNIVEYLMFVHVNLCRSIAVVMKPNSRNGLTVMAV